MHSDTFPAVNPEASKLYKEFMKTFQHHCDTMLHRVQTRALLRDALQNDEFVLEYQPIVGLHDGKHVSYEALIRWDNPTRGLLMPGKFLPTFSSLDMSVALDQWVLRRASQDCVKWRKHAPEFEVSVHVNLSGQQFSEPGLIERIESILTGSGLPPHCLKLEITEGFQIKDMKAACRALSTIRGWGVRVCLDDFGTGYCGLSYIQQLPIDTIKIDRSFVTYLCEKEESRSIVKTCIELASRLGLDVVAEGIEIETQRQALLELGCEYGQGFLF